MPNRGDIAFVDFKGAIGREQSGIRPALILTSEDYHAISSTAVVMPITSNIAPWPYKVLLPENKFITGAILVDQIKSVDRHHRGFRKLYELDKDTLEEVEQLLLQFLGIEE